MKNAVIKMKADMIRYPVNISIFLFLKPILEMFWQYPLLDYIMAAFLLALLFLNVMKRSIFPRMNVMNMIVLCIALLYGSSFFKQPGLENFSIFSKIAASYLMFFLGNFYGGESEKCIAAFRYGYLVTFWIDVVTLLFNMGFTTWGSADTFISFYYYKTDLSVALLNLIILTVIKPVYRYFDYFVLMMSSLMMVLSNSRVSLLVLVIIYVCAFLSKREQRSGRRVKINFKMIARVFIAMAGGLFLLRFLTESSFFKSRGFIGLDFRKLSDLFSASNTQGRLQIWTSVLDKFFQASFFDKITGISVNSDVGVLFGMSGGVSAHSLYLSILYSCGYAGICFFILFFFNLLFKLNDTDNRKLFWLIVMLVIEYLFYGISVSLNTFSGYTWGLMFFSGIVSAESIYKKRLEKKGRKK